MHPRTPDSSAMSAAETTSWYQAAKSSSRFTVRAWRMADMGYLLADWGPPLPVLRERSRGSSSRSFETLDGPLLAQFVELLLHRRHLRAQRIEVVARRRRRGGGRRLGPERFATRHERARRGLEHRHVGFGHLGEGIGPHARLP